VLTRPHDLSEERIGAELAAGWDFAAQSLSYLPVGFGSHHWLATDPAGRQLFLIVHDLAAMLRSQLDTADAAYGRLRAAFECAVSLHRDENLEFVVAPAPRRAAWLFDGYRSGTRWLSVRTWPTVSPATPQLQLLALGAADLERQENVGEAPEQREEPDPDQK